MMHFLWLIPGIFSAYVVLSPATAGTTMLRQVEVLASLPAQFGSNPAAEILVPLPYTLATDSEGREFRADSRGRLDLRFAKAPVTVHLDSPYVKVPLGRSRYGKKLSASEYADGGQLVFTELEAPAAARICRAHLEKARMTFINSFPRNEKPDFVEQPMPCDISAQVSPEVTRNFYRDYAKKAFARITSKNLPLLGESVAETFSSFVLDEAPAKNVADAYYSALWEIRQQLSRTLGPSRGKILALRLLFSSFIDFTVPTGVQPLSAAALSLLAAIKSDGEAAALPGFYCGAQQVFANHHLIVKGGCR